MIQSYQKTGFTSPVNPKTCFEFSFLYLWEILYLLSGLAIGLFD